ncbi:MAG: HAMP domain-containing histidine kinase, partial [Chitinophagaceae bacterium]|nr:HAMP domain-containing histidine kinase [Chitinophagaceae bacterium]
MISYDYERIRASVSNIDFKIPLEAIKVTGNFDETIFSSGKFNDEKKLFETKKKSEFVFFITKNIDFYYSFNIKLVDHTENSPTSEARILGNINLNSEIKEYLTLLFYKYLAVLLLLLLQGALIYFLGKRIASSLIKISKEVNTSDKYKKISDSLGENLETKQFIKSYNNKINKELELRGKLNEKENEIIIANAVSNLAKRVAHDIRSPLAALKVVREMGTSNLEPDVSKLLSMSIDRITDIANTILPKNKIELSTKLAVESSFIWMLIDQIVSEKRVEYKNTNNVSIQFTTEGTPFELNAVCNSSEFMRSISNIINNSIEAKIENKPIQIDLRLYSENNKVLLTISDNGKGISSEILPKVFDESFSHGKSQGTGLGLFQVKQAVKSWGGDAHIESQSGTG